MVNHLLSLAAILLISATASAQNTEPNVNIAWSPPFQNNKKYDKQRVVGYDAQGYYAVKHGLRTAFNKAMIKKLELSHYNTALKLVRNREVQLGSQGNWDFNNVVQMNNNLYLFASQLDNRNKTNKLYLRKIAKDNLTLSDAQLMASIDLRKLAVSSPGKKAINQQYMGSFEIQLSRDSSKMLVYYDLPSARKDVQNYGFKVLDENLQVLWEKAFEVPYQSELFEIEQVRIKNNGDVYVLGLFFNGVRRYSTARGVNYHYQLLSHKENGTKMVEHEIKLKDKFLLDMRLQFDVDGNILCGGFYSDLGRYSTAGPYVVKIDATTNKVLFSNAEHFDIDFMTNNLARGQEAKARKKALKGKAVETRELSVDHIVLKEEGGFLLIGEQFEHVRHTSYSPNMPNSSSTAYLYYDIIIINYSSDGKMLWKGFIPKHQKTANDGGAFSSYALTVVDDKMCFIFNDHALNLKKWPKGVVHDYDKSWDSYLVMVTIDAQGNKTKIPISDTNVVKAHANMHYVTNVGNGNLAFFGHSPKIRRLGELKFK